jgi:8-oxo-dGTP pyrophosphatase MutT (NUDIX family)
MNTAVGVFFYSRKTKRYLYLLRTDTNNWSIPGGKVEDSETLYTGLERECLEEIGHFPDHAKLIPIQKFVNNNFTYHTFFCAVDCEFSPVLNDEHYGYAWVEGSRYPKPLHNGLFNTINIDNVQEKLSILTETSVE